jgi:signal transduction histidine kinase
MDSGLAANEIFTMIALGIIIMLGLAIALVLLANRAQKKLHLEQLKSQALQLEHQQQLLYSTIQTQEEERRRIAKDLHDEIGNKLNVINLNLYRLRRDTLPAGELRETVRDLLEVIGKTIDTTRRISHDLLPPTLENFGLREAIRELCDAYPEEIAPRIHFEWTEEHTPPVDKTVELGFFRILQELLNNTLKHSSASRIGISLWLSAGSIRLHYQDDGRGFDPERIPDRAGLGLQNMESRASMIGADLELTSRPGSGVTANIYYKVPDGMALKPEAASLSRQP